MVLIEYLISGQLQRDIKTILNRLSILATQLSEVYYIMTVDLSEILTNQKNIQSAITQLADTQAKTLQDLKDEIARLQTEGADTTILQAIADSQQASLDAISNLQTAASEADPQVQSLIKEHQELMAKHEAHLNSLVDVSEIGPVDSKDVLDAVDAVVQPGNYPPANVPPANHPVSASTANEETARGNTTVVGEDGKTVTLNADGNVINEGEVPQSFMK